MIKNKPIKILKIFYALLILFIVAIKLFFKDIKIFEGGLLLIIIALGAFLILLDNDGKFKK